MAKFLDFVQNHLVFNQNTGSYLVVQKSILNLTEKSPREPNLLNIMVGFVPSRGFCGS